MTRNLVLTSTVATLYSSEMRANFHLHSRFSDGTDWPQDVAQRACAAGIKYVSLTDHDSLGGVPEFLEAAFHYGLRAVPGVEIDCRAPEIDYRSELLAYFPSGSFKNTQAFLEEVLVERLRIAKEAIQKASYHFPGTKLSFETLLDRKRAGRAELGSDVFSFNKVDIFLYLQSEGAIPQNVEYKAFKAAYFDSKLLSDSSRGKPSCTELAHAVLADGGYLVVPHIGHEFSDSASHMEKEYERLGKMLDYFKDIGISGLELYWYRNPDTTAINKLVRKAAKGRSLFCTYGSDCHGPLSGKETMASFSGNFKQFPKQEISR
ncbi:PHP domain-containing protein [Treponema sp.]